MPDWVGSITINSLQISLNLCKFYGLETCLLICERPIAFFSIKRILNGANRTLNNANRIPNSAKCILNDTKRILNSAKCILDSAKRTLTGINRILCFITPCFGLRHRGLKNTPSHCRFTISLHNQRLCIYCFIRAT